MSVGEQRWQREPHVLFLERVGGAPHQADEVGGLDVIRG